MTIQNSTQNTDRVRPSHHQDNREDRSRVADITLRSVPNTSLSKAEKRESQRAKKAKIAEMQKATLQERLDGRIGYHERLTHKTQPIIDIIKERCKGNDSFKEFLRHEANNLNGYSFDGLQSTLYMIGRDGTQHKRRFETLCKLAKHGHWRNYPDRKKRATYVLMTYFKEINLNENLPRQRQWNNYSESDAVAKCEKLISKALKPLEGKNSPADIEMREQYERALKFVQIKTPPKSEALEDDLELAKQRKAHENAQDEGYDSTSVATSTIAFSGENSRITSDKWYEVNKTLCMVDDDNFDKNRNPDAVVKAFFKLNDGDKIDLLQDISDKPNLYKKYMGIIHKHLEKRIKDAFAHKNKAKIKENIGKMHKLTAFAKSVWDEEKKGSLFLTEPTDILINLVGEKYGNSHLKRALRYPPNSTALKESVQDMLVDAKRGMHLDVGAEKDFTDAAAPETETHKKMAMKALSDLGDSDIQHVFESAAMISEIYNMSEDPNKKTDQYPNSAAYLHDLCDDFDDTKLRDMPKAEREKILKVKKISAKYAHHYDKSFFKKSKTEQTQYLKRLADHPKSYKDFIKSAYDDRSKKLKEAFDNKNYQKMDKYVAQLKDFVSISSEINPDMHEQHPQNMLLDYMAEKHGMPNMTLLLRGEHALDSDAEQRNNMDTNLAIQGFVLSDHSFFTPKDKDKAQDFIKDVDCHSDDDKRKAMDDLCQLHEKDLKEFFEVALIISKNADADNNTHPLSKIDKICKFFDEDTLETLPQDKKEKILAVKALSDTYLRKSDLHHLPDEKRTKRVIEYQFNQLAKWREESIAMGVNQLACDNPNPEDIDKMVKALLFINPTERKGAIQRIAIKSGDKIFLKLMRAVQKNIDDNYDIETPKATFDIQKNDMLLRIGQLYKTLEEEKPLGIDVKMQYPVDLVIKHLRKKYFPKDAQDFTLGNLLKIPHSSQKEVMHSLKIMMDYASHTASYDDIKKIRTISTQFIEDLHQEKNKGTLTEKEAGRLQKMIEDNLGIKTDGDLFEDIDMIIDKDFLSKLDKERELIDKELIDSTMISAGKMFMNSLISGVEEGVDAEDKIDAFIKSAITATSFKMIDDIHGAVNAHGHLKKYIPQIYSDWINGVNAQNLDLGGSPLTASDQAVQVAFAATLGVALKTIRDLYKDHNNVPDIKKLEIDDTALKNIGTHAFNFGTFAVANGLTGATFHLPNAIKNGWELGRDHTLGEVASEITRKSGAEGVVRGSMITAAEMLHMAIALASKSTTIHMGWGLMGMAVATPAAAVGLSALGCAGTMATSAGTRKLTDMARDYYRDHRENHRRYISPELTGDISEKSLTDEYKRLVAQTLESSLSGNQQDTAEAPEDSGVEETKEYAA